MNGKICGSMMFCFLSPFVPLFLLVCFPSFRYYLFTLIKGKIWQNVLFISGTRYNFREPFLPQVGLVYVRGCEMEGMLDSNGRVVEDGPEPKPVLPGDTRTFRVWLDCNQYRNDMDNIAQSGSEVRIFYRLNETSFSQLNRTVKISLFSRMYMRLSTFLWEESQKKTISKQY